MNALELFEFNRAHRKAGMFLWAATNDYIACRCCLLSGLFPGLRLGGEAVEKFLKAFVLYSDPSVNVEKRYHHQIRPIAVDAEKIEPRFDQSRFKDVFERLEIHYRNRYPDVPNFSIEASTAELAGIDDLILHIGEWLPIPEAPKFRNYGPFFLMCCSWLPTGHPNSKWLQQDNLAFQRAKAFLLERYEAAEKQLEG